jgi:hypothetical protein
VDACVIQVTDKVKVARQKSILFVRVSTKSVSGANPYRPRVPRGIPVGRIVVGQFRGHLTAVIFVELPLWEYPLLFVFAPDKDLTSLGGIWVPR